MSSTPSVPQPKVKVIRPSFCLKRPDFALFPDAAAHAHVLSLPCDKVEGIGLQNGGREVGSSENCCMK